MPIVEATCDTCEKTLKEPKQTFAIMTNGAILCEACVEKQNLEDRVLKWLQFPEPTTPEEPAEVTEEAPAEETVEEEPVIEKAPSEKPAKEESTE